MTLTICDGFGLGMKKWVLLYNQSPDRNNPTLASLSCLFPCLCHFLCLCLIPNTRSQGLRMSILHNKTSKPEFSWGGNQLGGTNLYELWYFATQGRFHKKVAVLLDFDQIILTPPSPQFRQLVPLFLNANAKDTRNCPEKVIKIIH